MFMPLFFHYTTFRKNENWHLFCLNSMSIFSVITTAELWKWSFERFQTTRWLFCRLNLQRILIKTNWFLVSFGEWISFLAEYEYVGDLISCINLMYVNKIQHIIKTAWFIKCRKQAAMKVKLQMDNATRKSCKYVDIFCFISTFNYIDQNCFNCKQYKLKKSYYKLMTCINWRHLKTFYSIYI